MNEGVVGRAFKIRDLSIYILPELLRKRENRGVYVYYSDGRPAAETDRYSVLVALPLYLGPQRLGKEVSPEEVVGVFTLA